MRSIFKYVAVICLLLTLWSAAAVILHHHANGSESATCTVCVAAQSTAPGITANLVQTTFAAVFTIHVEPVSAHGRLISFALSVRPPPAV